MDITFPQHPAPLQNELTSFPDVFELLYCDSTALATPEEP